ncbi:lipocalin family protein [Lacinutrix sp. Hel_I_90]|uniref:lipocalin family protein n=1 Tax=Lacinutrix sp. Hel_I_90 TaxID=1249999 RepID=UPI0005CA6BF5|nr:lipocalin family protein [Lacinutrix sp. Hel_I_90]
MKKLNLLLALFIGLLIFSSCSNDDDDNETELSVVGGWTVGATTLNGEIITNQSITRLLSAENRAEFRYLILVGEGDLELTVFQGNWSRDGNTLTIVFDDADMGTNIYNITELTSNSMTWESEILGEGILKETLTR